MRGEDTLTCWESTLADTQKRCLHTLTVDTQRWCLHMLRADPQQRSPYRLLWSSCAHAAHAVALMRNMELDSHAPYCAPLFSKARAVS